MIDLHYAHIIPFKIQMLNDVEIISTHCLLQVYVSIWNVTPNGKIAS